MASLTEIVASSTEIETTMSQTSAGIIAKTTSPGRTDSVQLAFMLTIPLTIMGFIAVGILSAVLIWRRRRVMGKGVISYYRKRTSQDVRCNRPRESLPVQEETYTYNECILENQNGNGSSVGQYKGMSIEDVANGYCAVGSNYNLPIKPLGDSAKRSNCQYDTIDDRLIDQTLTDRQTGNVDHKSSETTWFEMYDTLQTNTSKSKTTACKLAYDHVIMGDRSSNIKNEDSVSYLNEAPLEANVVNLKDGRVTTEQNNANDDRRLSDVRDTYTSDQDNRISHRFVILEPDGFYFAQEETD